MDYNALYRQFNAEFWDYFLSLEQARNRKGITFNRWVKRSRAAQKAIKEYLEANGAPKENPFFWVQRFPEPQPHNLNGARFLPDEPLVRAIHNGVGGIFTRAEAELYNMQIKGEFKL